MNARTQPGTAGAAGAAGAFEVQAPEAADAVLRISDLSITLGAAAHTDTARPLVQHLSLSVARGEKVGVIGESGSGKSLTSLAISGLLPSGMHASGSIRLCGSEVIGAAPASLRRLRGPAAAIVFQEPRTALDPLMRVGKQVAEPLRRHRGLRGSELQAAVAASLTEVALDPAQIARSFPHELSGGQRQRIAIAIALAAQPQLLIADEPTTALDVTVQADVLTLLRTLVAQRGMGLLFVSHDLSVVSQLVDRVIVLQRGVIVEEGSVAQVLHHPQHPYTTQLVTHARELDRALRPRDIGGQ